MVTELTILERLLLLSILPPAGDLVTIKIARKLREELSFSEDELATYNIVVQDGGNVSWEDMAYTKAIDLGAKAIETVVKALEKLDKEGKVEEKHLALFDKFGVGE